jgi:hypothetical protein
LIQCFSMMMTTLNIVKFFTDQTNLTESAERSVPLIDTIDKKNTRQGEVRQQRQKRKKRLMC